LFGEVASGRAHFPEPFTQGIGIREASGFEFVEQERRITVEQIQWTPQARRQAGDDALTQFAQRHAVRGNGGCVRSGASAGFVAAIAGDLAVREQGEGHAGEEG
jgi:hypothetical protein